MTLSQIFGEISEVCLSIQLGEMVYLTNCLVQTKHLIAIGTQIVRVKAVFSDGLHTINCQTLAENGSICEKSASLVHHFG
jgi:hypothetical protein